MSSQPDHTDCVALSRRIAELEQQCTAYQQQLDERHRLLHEERTRRRAAEDALHHSETLFRSLIEKNSDPLIVVHNEIIQYVNEAAEKLLERRASELEGAPIGMILANSSTEVDVIGKGGSLSIADMRVIEIEWEGERMSLTSLRDITEYKRVIEELRQSQEALEQRVQQRTEELTHTNAALQTEIEEHRRTELALRESEARYRALVYNFPDGIVLLFDHSLRVLVAGGRQLATLGMTSEKVEGKTIWEAVPPDICTIGEPLFRATLAGTAPEELEIPYDDRIHRTQPVPLRNEQGDIIAGMIITQDITERKQMEKTLEQLVVERTGQLFAVIEELHLEIGERERINRDLERSRDLLRLIFDSIDDSLVLLDHNGRVLAANQPVAALLGWETPNELINQSWVEMCQAEGQQLAAVCCSVQWVLDTLQDGQPHRRRESGTRSDGVPQVLDMQTLPVLYPRNTGDSPLLVDQVILHISDVTERVQLEQLQLENERLTAIRRLSQIVAHEVNTPLQTILNALEGLHLANETQRNHFLTLAQAEIERVGAILHRLRDPLLTATEKMEWVDIAALLERVLTLIDTTLKKHQIVVKRTIALELPPILACPGQLTQVFLNLMINAIDAMPSGGMLGVTCHLVASGGQGGDTNALHRQGRTSIRVEISDTGVGIAPDMQEHIFDSFFTTKEFGTGLGLAVSQRIVSEHQGTIRVWSQAGEGTTFEVELPLPD